MEDEKVKEKKEGQKEEKNEEEKGGEKKIKRKKFMYWTAEESKIAARLNRWDIFEHFLFRKFHFSEHSNDTDFVFPFDEQISRYLEFCPSVELLQLIKELDEKREKESEGKENEPKGVRGVKVFVWNEAKTLTALNEKHWEVVKWSLNVHTPSESFLIDLMEKAGGISRTDILDDILKKPSLSDTFRKTIPLKVDTRRLSKVSIIFLIEEYKIDFGLNKILNLATVARELGDVSFHEYLFSLKGATGSLLWPEDCIKDLISHCHYQALSGVFRLFPPSEKVLRMILLSLRSTHHVFLSYLDERFHFRYRGLRFGHQQNEDEKVTRKEAEEKVEEGMEDKEKEETGKFPADALPIFEYSFDENEFQETVFPDENSRKEALSGEKGADGRTVRKMNVALDFDCLNFLVRSSVATSHSSSSSSSSSSPSSFLLLHFFSFGFSLLPPFLLASFLYASLIISARTRMQCSRLTYSS